MCHLLYSHQYFPLHHHVEGSEKIAHESRPRTEYTRAGIPDIPGIIRVLL